jgi:hypothetical protein
VKIHKTPSNFCLISKSDLYFLAIRGSRWGRSDNLHVAGEVKVGAVRLVASRLISECHRMKQMPGLCKWRIKLRGIMF